MYINLDQLIKMVMKQWRILNMISGYMIKRIDSMIIKIVTVLMVTTVQHTMHIGKCMNKKSHSLKSFIITSLTQEKNVC